MPLADSGAPAWPRHAASARTSEAVLKVLAPCIPSQQDGAITFRNDFEDSLSGYRGRFAPSPTGALHQGSLVAALASWLDARAHGGRWLVRIEDVDTPRCVPGASQTILQQLAACGLFSDAPVLYQSERGAAYQQALDTLIARGLAYPCACSRQAIQAALAARGWQHQRHAEMPYPGTCRHGLPAGTPAQAPRAWRLDTTQKTAKTPNNAVLTAAPAIENRANRTPPQAPVRPASGGLRWFDRRLGWQQPDPACEVGDFVLRRADGLWAYQLAVTVDDAAQGISHVVRGQDLASNTPRQILLQQALGLPTPAYLHTPLVLAADGQKLSKQNGAQPLDTRDPLACLNAAAATLGLALQAPGRPLNDALAAWTAQWRQQPPPGLKTPA